MQEDKYKAVQTAKALEASLELRYVYLKEDHKRVTALLDDAHACLLSVDIGTHSSTQ